MRVLYKICVVFVILVAILSISDARRKKNSKALILRQKETNPVNFIRIAAMRFIYGVATRMGLGDQISEALNGAFVPPGVDDYDYDDEGIGLFNREDDDDDYDY